MVVEEVGSAAVLSPVAVGVVLAVQKMEPAVHSAVAGVEQRGCVHSGPSAPVEEAHDRAAQGEQTVAAEAAQQESAFSRWPPSPVAAAPRVEAGVQTAPSCPCSPRCPHPPECSGASASPPQTAPLAAAGPR